MGKLAQSGGSQGHTATVNTQGYLPVKGRHCIIRRLPTWNAVATRYYIP